MPNIRTYNAGDLALHPTETGVSAFAQAGRRIGGIYSDIASAQRQGGNAIAQGVGEGIAAAGKAYVDYLDHQEISRGMPAAAMLLDSLQQKANEITKNADPNNPSVFGEYRDKVLEPALSKFQESFTTENSQRWAMEQANGIREHMERTVRADMSTMAASAVRLNLEKTTNILSNTVSQDPSALPTVLASLEHSVGATVDSSPTITPTDATRVKGEVLQKMTEHIVKSAVQGAILKNPDAGLKMAQDPKYAPYLDGSDVNMFYREVVRANKADATNARLEAERALRDNSAKNRDQIITELYNGKNVTMNQVLAIPPTQITPEDREHLLNVIEKREVDIPEAVAKRNAVDLITDIHNGKITSLDQINKAFGEGKIDYTRFNEVKKEFVESRSPEGETLGRLRGDFLKQYFNVVNPNDLIKGRTEDGYRRAYQLERYAAIREGELRAAGKDPSVLYDPRSPVFIGNTPYAKPTSSVQLLQNYKGGNAPPLPSHTAEPPAQYPDAKQAPNGNWYVEKDGKFYQVK